MVDDKDIGYYEELINGSSIVRARTIRVIRSWEFPRSLESIETFYLEFGKSEVPGIYLLFDFNLNKVYIGEAKNIYNRLKTHINTPEDKIKNWDRVIIINDGRLATQSDFNDNVIRLATEIYLIKLFKLNKYNVVAQGDEQTLNGQQKSIFNSLLKELNYFLQKKNLISKFIKATEEQEVLLDELKRILSRKGYIHNLTSHKGTVDNKKAFIRPGSEKSKGWQVTFRDEFKKALEDEDGILIMPRGKIVVMPFENLKTIILDIDKKVFTRSTIDIFIAFQDEKVLLRFKGSEIDITQTSLLK
jgi:predicted GIY-YIG superfamily endonuclease